MNTYAKYCPNVFVAKCTEKHDKGEIIKVETKYGKENECRVWNFLLERDGFYYYSITRTDGYNVQKRAESKAERLLESSARAEMQASATIERGMGYLSGIEPGQPILVGHHSERHHRRAIEKSDNAMHNACELYKKAESYEQRAEYWKQRSNVINLSMPESIEYYRWLVEQRKQAHQFLKDHPDQRPHAYALQYANKDLKEAEDNLKRAIKLWGENETNN